MAKAKLNSDLLLKYQNFSKFGLVTSAFIHMYKKKIQNNFPQKVLPFSLHDAHTVPFLVRRENLEKKKKQHSRFGRKSPLSGNGRMLSTKYY